MFFLRISAQDQGTCSLLGDRTSEATTAGVSRNHGQHPVIESARDVDHGKDSLHSSSGSYPVAAQAAQMVRPVCVFGHTALTWLPGKPYPTRVGRVGHGVFPPRADVDMLGVDSGSR